jgi:hypothetical protein
MVKRGYLLGIGAFLGLLCLMAILYLVAQQGGIPLPTPSGNYTQHSSGQTSALSVQVTDPSFLPKGTTALLVTFSNASVYSQGRWISGGGFGPVNIMTQGNQSVTVSSIAVPSGAAITAARLGIKSASIVINGVKYNATFGSSILTNLSSVTIQGDKTLVLQLSPFALTSANSNGGVRLGYSSRGYILNGSGSYIGQSSHVVLESSSAASPYANISIQNTAVSTSGGVTSVKVTVVNHSNRTAHIGSIAVVGNENFSHNSSAIEQLANGYTDQIMQNYQAAAQASGSSNGGSTLLNSFFNTTAIRGSTQINQQTYSQALSIGSNLTNIVYSNVSALAAIAGPIPKALFGSGSGTVTNTTVLRAALYQNIYNEFYNASVSQSDFQSNVGSVDFAPSQDGTLQQSYNSSTSGYSVPPDSTATFNYTGQMALDSATSIGLVPQSSYDVVVAGSDGTSANATVDST